MADFEINGKSYRANKLNAFQQFGIAKRIAPLILALNPDANQLQNFGLALAGLSDEAGEYVISTCLSVVQRLEGNNWGAVWNTAAKRANFMDLYDLAALLPIVIKVIEENLGNFLTGLPMIQATEASPAKSSGAASRATSTT